MKKGRPETAAGDEHRAFTQPKRGTPEDIQRINERSPGRNPVMPNCLAAGLFVLQNSELYRAISWQDLTGANAGIDALGGNRSKVHPWTARVRIRSLRRLRRRALCSGHREWTKAIGGLPQ